MPNVNSISSANYNIECRKLLSPTVVLSVITTIALLILTALTITGLLPHTAILLPTFLVATLVAVVILTVCVKCSLAHKELEENDKSTNLKPTFQRVQTAREMGLDVAIELRQKLNQIYEKLKIISNDTSKKGDARNLALTIKAFKSRVEKEIVKKPDSEAINIILEFEIPALIMLFELSFGKLSNYE